jgi:hypothetical protein
MTPHLLFAVTLDTTDWFEKSDPPQGELTIYAGGPDGAAVAEAGGGRGGA